MHSDRRGMDLGMIPRDSFETFLGTLHSDESMSIVRAAVARHNTRSRNSSLALASLLKVTYIFRQGLEASDPRDHIFAFLGMSVDAANLRIVPDYSKSKAQVFTEVAMALIEQVGLEVLTWCKFRAPPEEDCRLPSWAPDWSDSFLRPLSKFKQTTNFRYMASGDSAPQFRFLNGGNEFPTLCLSGVQADNIFAVGQVLTHCQVSDITWLTDDQDPNYRLQLEWLSDIDQLSTHCGNVYGSP
jgi:hypothetical protein